MDKMTKKSSGDEACVSPQPPGRQGDGERCPDSVIEKKRVAAASAHGIDEHVLAQLPANLREEIKMQILAETHDPCEGGQGNGFSRKSCAESQTGR